jgi:hypothetical protein
MQAARSGPQAVANAQNYGQLKSRGDAQAAHVAGGLDKAMAAAPATQPGYRATQNYTQQVRVVNGRAFYQNGDNWSDSTQQAKKDLKAKSVRFNSDEYFALLRDHPSAAQWLALGNNVDVVIDDTLYSIRDN